ncbi:rab-GTPase-TBC domain-containing protein [Gloeopeniophorella convolvens]|nr:rab-GTPase-TBC domain-containing protein [Gloeopeniophorella convolvens]
MDAPNLVVVPPTPLYTSLAASPSPSVSTAPSTPELTQSSDENQRSSSETTMEIYSMYGDDEPSSWPNDSPLKDKRATDVTYRSSARVSREASAYHSTAASSHRTSRTSGPRRTSAVSSTSRASSDAGSPYGGVDNEDMSAALRSILPPAPLVRPSQRHSSLSPPQHASPPQSRYLSPSPPHSRPSSSRSHASSAPHAHASSSSARRRSSQGAAPSEHISMASRPPSATTATSTSPRLLQKKRSDLSITPSVGEDPDSFHVRSTYAQLDVLGVKGDGIEEGVERTRARIGTSRESELMATNAIGDEEEKRRDLSPQEIQVLSSLDRYGFFSAPSHDRLVLVPSAALHKPLSRQTRPVTTASTSATSLSKLPPPRPPRREDERMEKWGRMLEPRSRDSGGNIQTWGMNPAKEHKLSRRAFKGIPNRWRSAAWLALLNNYSHTGKEQLQALAQEYREALEKHSAYDIQIDLDVPRTISGHVLFRTRYGLGQRSLFHVLHSFSLRCERCGYCQGMGPIAAMLLCYFAPERAYASLVHLHDAYHMHDIFSPGFPGLLESIYVQERIMEEMMPAVYVAFKKHMISTTSYATKWYITLFANSVPFQTHLRLWDAFLLEGPDLFVIVAIAIIWAYRDHITADAANFETVLSLLSSFFVPEDEDVFLEWISKVAENRKVRSDMEGWRVQWKELVASGRDGDALL